MCWYALKSVCLCSYDDHDDDDDEEGESRWPKERQELLKNGPNPYPKSYLIPCVRAYAGKWRKKGFRKWLRTWNVK